MPSNLTQRETTSSRPRAAILLRAGSGPAAGPLITSSCPRLSNDWARSEPTSVEITFDSDLHGGGSMRRPFKPRMSAFRLSRPVDAAYCTVNTFRHLLTEQAARRHLERLASSLRPGASMFSACICWRWMSTKRTLGAGLSGEATRK